MSNIKFEEINAVTLRLIEPMIAKQFQSQHSLFSRFREEATDSHLWKSNLREMARMLAGGSVLPHGQLFPPDSIDLAEKLSGRKVFVTNCSDCRDAYNLRVKYRQEKDVIPSHQ